MSSVRYVHTNIVARDWRSLARFYVRVFDCEIVPPERDLSGGWLEDLTSIADARLQGAHLALPGYPDNGPTLELFTYSPQERQQGDRLINREGLGHIAFSVDDVEQTVQRILLEGGSILGKVVRKRFDALGMLTVAYCQDPEGNYVEVQHWSRDVQETQK